MDGFPARDGGTISPVFDAAADEVDAAKVPHLVLFPQPQGDRRPDVEIFPIVRHVADRAVDESDPGGLD